MLKNKQWSQQRVCQHASSILCLGYNRVKLIRWWDD